MKSTTDILRERAADQDSLARTYAISLAGHVVVIAVIMFWPAGFFSGSSNEVMADVMTISLGGPAGPSQGGQTALASRPVQELLPLIEASEPQWVQPPAPAPPGPAAPRPFSM